jgi:poly(hydroxyalkanoate) depolymerase family esterase
VQQPILDPFVGKVQGRALPVLDLDKLMAGLARHKRAWPNGPFDGAPAPLTERRGFGSNPGNLRMFSHVPAGLAPGAALVVVLHGCTQTAAGYDHGAGWSTLADRYGFALLLPEQQRANNPNACFSWFEPGDTARDRGEALSIRQMIAAIVADAAIDPARVFITGLSAGGAMTSAMLACYPDLFAAGAIIAGLPYGAAGNVQQAFESMLQCPTRPARAWGDLVRAASGHRGPWPRLSVWHGSADTTVIARNADEILKQWTDLHGLPPTPSDEALVDGYPRKTWRDADGRELIESYTITHMAHGTPLAAGAANESCGVAGPFLLDVGISSSYHIARFFGLTGDLRQAAPKSAAREPERGDERAAQKPGHLDIGSVITRALQSAGLMRR